MRGMRRGSERRSQRTGRFMSGKGETTDMSRFSERNKELTATSETSLIGAIFTTTNITEAKPVTMATMTTTVICQARNL